MGWLWGNGGADSASRDKLDPSLREFLESETPNGPTPALPSKPKATPTPKPSETQTVSAFPETNAAESPAAPVVPPQSQFQDGRYAHLWKNYTPQNVLDDRGKSEQDRLRDIVDAYNDRRGAIGRVAMENCALEYMEQFDCFKNPSWGQAITLCREESRNFNRCYDIQSKFLKALGYLTMDQRSPEEDERIQMHADKLYQQLKEQEALIKQARDEGREPPKFESVLSKRNITRAAEGLPLTSKPAAGAQQTGPDDETDVWSHIKPSAREEYEKKLAELPIEEQELERSAMLGELRAQSGMAKKVEATFVEERINRMKRRETGQATIGDTIKRLWGWD